jgi:hypothetical protein
MINFKAPVFTALVAMSGLVDVSEAQNCIIANGNINTACGPLALGSNTTGI